MYYPIYFTRHILSSLTLKTAGGGCGKTSVADMACMPSIFIKTSQIFFVESCWISAFTKKFFGKLRLLEVGPRGRWKRSSIFQSSHPSKKSMLPKANEQRKKKTICEIFHQKKIQKVLMKIEEMADVFLNSANFASHAFLTLAPPSGYALNLKALIKVSKVSWTSQLSYEILRSSFERKFDKTNFISPKRTPPKSPHQIGLNLLTALLSIPFNTIA